MQMFVNGAGAPKSASEHISGTTHHPVTHCKMTKIVATALENLIRESKLEPASCVLRHVTSTSRLIVAAFDAALSPAGLTGHQFNLLVLRKELSDGVGPRLLQLLQRRPPFQEIALGG